MSDEITVRFKWTADEYMVGMKSHYRAQYPRIVHIIFWGFLYLTVIAGLVATILLGMDGGGFGIMCYGIIALFCFRVLQPWLLRRQFSKRPDGAAGIEWRISDEGLKSSTPNGKGEQNWAAFLKVVQTPSGFIFYPTAQIFQWLPRSGFASDSDFDRLAQIAQKNAGNFKRIA